VSGGRKLWLRFKAKFVRTFKWEFWPPYIFYIPVALNYILLSLRYRALTLPFCTNPGTINGYQAGESKAFSLGRLFESTPEHIAEAWLIEGVDSDAKEQFCLNLIREQTVSYPCILKPDCGNRGSGVKLIHNAQEVSEYLHRIQAPVILQRYHPGPKEAGVFYYRYPNEEKGQLFAITEKIFPKVIGDGKSTFEELIWNDERAYVIADKYLTRFANDLERIPAVGEVCQLVQAGNHAQGCIFYDGWHLATDKLAEQMDRVAKGLNEFYFGRFDIRYAEDDDLKAGKNFQILEVNGFASEATSIYDPRNSLWSAYSTLFRQWRIVFKIGSENRKRKFFAPSLRELIQRGRQYKKQQATHPTTD
jgi:hypothetical protein